ncbi:MAG: hypothetical protein RLZZ399_2062 [Verrucomicrobiota bacterium]|jgi:hypothetical protein
MPSRGGTVAESPFQSLQAKQFCAIGSGTSGFPSGGFVGFRGESDTKLLFTRRVKGH